MPDKRTEQLNHLRAARGARRVHVLTICSPFCMTTDRLVLVEREQGSMLSVCRACDFNAPLDHGDARPVDDAALHVFNQNNEGTAEAWLVDYIPEGVYDGLTVILEQADADGYRRVRMMNPPAESAHWRLLSSWKKAFPAVRALLR